MLVGIRNWYVVSHSLGKQQEEPSVQDARLTTWVVGRTGRLEARYYRRQGLRRRHEDARAWGNL